MEPEKPGLFDDWGDVKKELISGLSGTKSTVMKTLIENQARFLRQMEEADAQKTVRVVPMTKEEEADEIIRRLKTPPPKSDPLGDLRNVILPMIKRITPGVIAQEIIGVQPMTGPVADIKTMKVIYSDSVKEDAADKGTGS